MMLYSFLCYVLIVPVIHGDKVTLTNVSANSTTVNSASANSSKLSFPSEGGTLDLTQPLAINLQTLEDETVRAKNKSNIHGRKGVSYPVNITNIEKNTDNSLKETMENNNTKETQNELQTKSKPSFKTNSTISLQQPSVVPKKPVILSYEALSNADKNIKSEVTIPATNPSSKTMASSQIPSPNEVPIIQVYPAKANSHPGMIMPIVITILVVPMFAIIGYMVLKRGQEAWKNRHYKRMDFLLDGMYND